MKVDTAAMRGRSILPLLGFYNFNVMSYNNKLKDTQTRIIGHSGNTI